MEQEDTIDDKGQVHVCLKLAAFIIARLHILRNSLNLLLFFSLPIWNVIWGIKLYSSSVKNNAKKSSNWLI